MRVVIDAVPLLIRSAGVKNYLYYWIGHLRRLAGADSILTFPPLGGLGPLTHEASVAGPVRTFCGLGALALSNYTPLPVLDWAARGPIEHGQGRVVRERQRAQSAERAHGARHRGFVGQWAKAAQRRKCEDGVRSGKTPQVTDPVIKVILDAGAAD